MSSGSRTLSDELDWKLFDQLHVAVSQFSGFCFEIKKFCVTTEFVVISLIATLTKSVDVSMFVAAAVISVSFWILDATAYYYQVKVRGRMEEIRRDILKRSSLQEGESEISEVIDIDRSKGDPAELLFKAIFNHSMWIYAIILFVNMVVFFLYMSGLVS
ncbi:hypothetical protein E5C33_08895 [Stenotrophomonas maltophilia]|uniref:hypothetical protein n=1 Tax=Stenotrophomonas maltophilia TaxID=40324 RepID=UPI001075D063|nr:hypothetical protein [Stenotrophomonas maltophilia]TFZ45587.1 hypothetical protein E5C33_08895 [Stenotrophomonas maltophilia]